MKKKINANYEVKERKKKTVSKTTARKKKTREKRKRETNAQFNHISIRYGVNLLVLNTSRIEWNHLGFINR